MPYININEYDNTITGPKTYTGNVVAVPIIATDGPYDKWVTVYTYDDFIQMFGPKPISNSNSLFGSSWEYAVNLLMRKMPVCVRRITHELDENGENIGGSELPGVSTAATVLKVADILGNLSMNSENLKTITFDVEHGDIKDSFEHSKIKFSKIGNISKNEFYYNYPVTDDDIKTVDGKDTDDYTFDSIYALESYSLNNQLVSIDTLTRNSFADVKDDGSSYPWISSEAEWFYTGGVHNPHHKKLNEKDVSETSNYVKDLYEVLDANATGEKGDFYLLADKSAYDEDGNINSDAVKINYDFNSKYNTNEKVTRIDYVKGGYKNPNLFYGSDANGVLGLDHPAQLIGLDIFNSSPAATKDSFVEVYSNADGSSNKKVWTYTNVGFFQNVSRFSTYLNKQPSSLNNNDKVILYEKDVNDNKLTNVIKLYTIIHNIESNKLELDKSSEKTLYLNLTSLKENTKDEQTVESTFVIFNDTNTSETFNEGGMSFYKKTAGKWNIDESDDNKEIAKEYSTYFTVVKNNKWIGSYESLDKLNNYPYASLGDFATIIPSKDNESISSNIYMYKIENGIKTWSYTNYPVSQLNTPIVVNLEDYENNTIFKLSKTMLIPWIQTNSTTESGRYKRKLYWKVADTDDKHNYLINNYWAPSNNPINTNSHIVIRDAKTYVNDVTVSGTADVDKTSLSTKVNGYTDISIKKDYENNRLVSGKIKITNESIMAIKIYGFRISSFSDSNTESTLLYNAGIERIRSASERITNDPYVSISRLKPDGEYETISLSDLRPKRDDTLMQPQWYVELEPGYKITYNKNLTNAQVNLKFAVYDDSDIRINLYESLLGGYSSIFSTVDTLEIEKTAIPVTSKDDTDISDIDRIDISDGKGNFNLFKVSYLYPGSNGDTIKTCVKTIKNQGVYIYVYRNSQYLERLELCSFRTQLSNGKVKILDIDVNKDDIWRMILEKFQLYIGINDKSEFPKPIIGTYVKVELNHNIPDYNTYDYVTALLAQTGSTFYRCANGGDADEEHVKHEIPNCYEPLKDKYRYDIKFISNGGFIDDFVTSNNLTTVNSFTSGSRPIEDAMLDVATTRKDCVAYLDIPFDASVEDVPFYFEHISSSYAAAYDPWCYISLSTGGMKWMPPSFVQLYTHAKSIANGNKMYLPPAGVRRALVPEVLKTNHDLPSSYITDWQNSDAPQFINPIIWINGFDYSIYGQKTLYNVVNQSKLYQSALQNLNVRLVANEIKKLIFKTCIELTFELNNIMTWNEFKAKLEPTLSVMQGEGVLTTYEVIMGTETMTSADLNSGHIVGTVRVAIVSAATDWDISFEIQPNDITFYENDYNSAYSE